MPTHTEREREKKGKLNQPGTVNKGLAGVRRKQAKEGAKNLTSGNADYSGVGAGGNKVVDTLLGGPSLRYAGNVAKDTYKKGFLNTAGRVYSDARTGAGDLYEGLAGIGQNVARDVRGGAAEFSAGTRGLDRPETEPPVDPSVRNYGFDQFDSEFGGLPDRSEDVFVPEGSREVTGAPGVRRVGDSYTNIDSAGRRFEGSTAEGPVDAEGYTASGRFVGVNPGESDYDRNTEGLSQINRETLDLIRGNRTEPEVSFEQLLASNASDKVVAKNKRLRTKLRHELSRGSISSRRYSEAIARLGEEDLAATSSATTYGSKPHEVISAEADRTRSRGVADAAGAGAEATRYAADVKRRSALDTILANRESSLRESGTELEKSRLSGLSDLYTSEFGRENIKEFGNPFLAGGSGGSRKDLDRLRKQKEGQ